MLGGSIPAADGPEKRVFIICASLIIENKVNIPRQAPIYPTGRNRNQKHNPVYFRFAYQSCCQDNVNLL